MNRLAIALTAIALLCVPGTTLTAAERYEGVIESWEATTVQMDVGKMVIVRLGVMQWTTADERATLLTAFREGGSDAVVKLLHEQSEKGYVQFPNTTAYQMTYAYQGMHDGKRYVVMATDRPTRNAMWRQAQDTTQNNITLLSLELDPETGKGTGAMIYGADITFDEQTGQIRIAHEGTQPIRFTSVRAVNRKEKKKKNE